MPLSVKLTVMLNSKKNHRPFLHCGNWLHSRTPIALFAFSSHILDKAVKMLHLWIRGHFKPICFISITVLERPRVSKAGTDVGPNVTLLKDNNYFYFRGRVRSEWKSDPFWYRKALLPWSIFGREGVLHLLHSSPPEVWVPESARKGVALLRGHQTPSLFHQSVSSFWGHS